MMILAGIPDALIPLIAGFAGLEFGKSVRKWQDKRAHDMQMKLIEEHGGHLPAGPDDYASGNPLLDLIGNGLHKLGINIPGGGEPYGKGKGGKDATQSDNPANRPEVSARDIRGMGAEPSLQNVISAVQGPRDLTGLGGPSMQGVTGAVQPGQQQPVGTSAAATPGVSAPAQPAPNAQVPMDMLGLQPPPGAAQIPTPTTNYAPMPQTPPQQGVTPAQESQLSATEAPPTAAPGGGIRAEMSMPTGAPQQQAPQPQQGGMQSAQQPGAGPGPMVEFDPHEVAPIIGQMAEQYAAQNTLPAGTEIKTNSPFGFEYNMTGPDLPKPARVPQSLQEALTQAVVTGDAAQIDYVARQMALYDPAGHDLEKMWGASAAKLGPDHPATRHLFDMMIQAKKAGSSSVNINTPPPGLMERYQEQADVLSSLTYLDNNFKDEYFGKYAGSTQGVQEFFGANPEAANYHTFLNNIKHQLITNRGGSALSPQELALALSYIPTVWTNPTIARQQLRALAAIVRDSINRTQQIGNSVQNRQPIDFNGMTGSAGGGGVGNAMQGNDPRATLSKTINPDTNKPFTDAEIKELGY